MPGSLGSAGSDSQSIRRLKKYGLKDRSPTISEETVVVEKKDKLECCKTNTLIGRYIALVLWATICLATFMCIYIFVYGDSDKIADLSKVEYGKGIGRKCPTNDYAIPWYYYYEEDGTIHCYWFAATPNVKKLTWWDAMEECENKKHNLNDADIGNSGKPGQKIKNSYLFIPETGDEFYRVVRHLTRLEHHKILFQRPNLTSHGNAEFWIGGRKCLYDYPIGESRYLDFYDYLWVPKDHEAKEVPPENVFCQVGQIHHWFTHRDKIIKTDQGVLKKKVSLTGECWDVKNEQPQQRMSFLERPFNVWTNKFMVEGSNPLHKRILEMEESQLLTSYRSYYIEEKSKMTGGSGSSKSPKICDFETYGKDNMDVQEASEDSIPFCVNLATYADPTKTHQSYNRDEEPDWTWYSYPCHWKSLYICEAEMETSAVDIEINKKNFRDNKKRIQEYWDKHGKSDQIKGYLQRDSL